MQLGANFINISVEHRVTTPVARPAADSAVAGWRHHRWNDVYTKLHYRSILVFILFLSITLSFSPVSSSSSSYIVVVIVVVVAAAAIDHMAHNP